LKKTGMSGCQSTSDYDGRNRRFEFAARIRTEEGTTHWVRLYRLADTEIVRHRKVMGAYNPFDLQWEVYGEDLRAKRLLKSMAYRR
ncbi:MAG TPA: hypothetical protein VF319_11350, partial [Caldimonas sp.]